MHKRAIIEAYEKAEREAGGLAFADVRACAEWAARECGMTYEAVREILTRHWSGTAGRG